MIDRLAYSAILDRLAQLPAVALLGPRQAGKTTLAHAVAEGRASVYLDLEAPRDLAKLSDPAGYLAAHEDELVVIDEVQRFPELFAILRGLIDDGRRRGKRAGRFLLLGSASSELIRQSETLAGRIAYLELTPLTILEVDSSAAERLWIRGGFPESYLAPDDRTSFAWREDFIRTYLERDVPELGPRIPATTLRRFWTMLAHVQGGLFNAAQLARGLAVDGKTAARYLDLLVDLLLVRRLQSFQANVGKRLVKSPKVYIRDSGVVHSLLGLAELDEVLGHPVAGGSWEGFAVENLIAAAPERTAPLFYRSAAGAEIDLLLEIPKHGLWAIEIKRGVRAKLDRGFRIACEDLKPARRLLVHPREDRYPLAEGSEAIGLRELAEELSAL